MERSATAFTPRDRIGQLAVQVERHRRHARDARAARGAAAVSRSGRDASRSSSRPRCGSSCGRRTPSCCPYDVQGTLLHAERLHAAGILDDAELAEVRERARAIGPRRIRAGDEDVHASIERQLGEVGRKIHAGRSRNDQVAAARPPLRAGRVRRGASARCVRSRPRSSTRAEREADTPMPGYTHLQRAQPGDARPPPARLGRDARARPRALRVRAPQQADAVAARRGRARRLDAAAAAAAERDAQLARRRRRPRLRPRLSLRARGRSSRTSRGSARSSCSGRRASSGSRGCRRTPRPARR